MLVVDGFEVVDIDHQHGQWRGFTFGLAFLGWTLELLAGPLLGAGALDQVIQKRLQVNAIGKHQVGICCPGDVLWRGAETVRVGSYGQ